MLPRRQKKHLLLCFDAFGTLFTPRKPIAAQYAAVSRKYGICDIREEDLHQSFKQAFKEQAKKYPNYGKAAGMKAPEWWANIIRSTLAPFTSTTSISTLDPITKELLTRFSTKDGYRLYDDVPRLFKLLQRVRGQSLSSNYGSEYSWKSITVGIITNSDDRVPGILRSFGLKVRDHGEELSPDQNVHFVTLSYDVGVEKPDPKIFEASEQTFKALRNHDGHPDNLHKIYVGDDVEKDTLAAMDAGWNSFYLDREERFGTAWTLEENKNGFLNTTERGRDITVLRDLDALKVLLA